MDRYAVVGNPVAHSVSPRIHAIFAAAAGQELRYEKILAEEFVSAAVAFFEDGGRGLNVTLPFKQDAFGWVDRVDDAAREAEAVNVVARNDDGYSGYNTDGIGLVLDLQDNLGLSLNGRRVLILGAGGAVRGVLGPLSRTGADELVVANRTETRARALRQVFPNIGVASLGDVRGAYDVVINGTSAGFAGEVPDIDPQAVRNAFCYDMSYAPGSDTPFCAWSRAHGAAGVSGGLGMLVEQAAETFLLWRGVRPPTAGVVAALDRG